MTEQYLFRRVNIPGAPRAVVATATIQATTDDNFLQVDVTAGSQNVRLPLAQEMPGIKITVQKSDASLNGVSVIPLAPNVINPANPSLGAQFDNATCVSDGTNWNVIAENP